MHRCELEIADGLEALAKAELLAHFNVNPFNIEQGAIQFNYQGDLRRLLELRIANAVYLRHSYDIPRPKALLGHQNFNILTGLIDAARAVMGYDQYETLYISAAGSRSSVMERIKEALANATGLTCTEDGGDLLVRIRRTTSGWDVLVRISPRPSATRSWRVCNMEGALNAPVAAAMVQLSNPQPDDTFLNLTCGSGTLMIERMAAGAAKQIIGVDNDPAALGCAMENLEAAGCAHTGMLLQADAATLPLRTGSVSVICADLPFGQLVGSHAENVELYPLLLAEAARVAVPAARFVLITHEVRLMERLATHLTNWQLEDVIRITQRGLHPRIFILGRT